MKNFLSSVLSIVVGGAIVMGLVFYAKPQSKMVGGQADGVGYMEITTSTARTVTTSASKNLMATNTARIGAIITNDGPNAVYLSLDSDKPALANRGILLAASSTYVIGPSNLYQGSVNAIATGASANVLITEK